MRGLFAVLRALDYPSFDLVSPLSRAECVGRLRQATEPARAVTNTYFMGIRIGGSPPVTMIKPVVGIVADADIRLSKRIDGFNSCQRVLFATLGEERNQTRVRCYAGIHPSVLAFMAVFFLILCWAVGGLISQGQTDVSTVNLFGLTYVFEGRWASAAGLFFIGGFAVFITVSGLRSSKGETEFLLNFLHDTIEARRAD